MTLLFDSDVLIDLLRGKQKTGIEVEQLIEKADEILCSVITVAEIIGGMKSEEKEATEGLLKDLIKVEVTEEIARLAANIKWKTKTHQLHLDDCLIAASALQTKAQLVTKNAKHYPFKELSVYRIK